MAFKHFREAILRQRVTASFPEGVQGVKKNVGEYLSIISHLIAHLYFTNGFAHACDYDSHESTPFMIVCIPFLYKGN